MKYISVSSIGITLISEGKETVEFYIGANHFPKVRLAIDRAKEMPENKVEKWALEEVKE